MKKFVAILAVAALAVPALALGNDVQPNGPQLLDRGKIVSKTTATETAVVKAVDVKKRTITLALDDGSWESFVVDPSFRRLKEVKPGDIVNVRYTEAMTVKLNKTPVPPGLSVKGAASSKRNSAKPAGTKELRVSTTATITKIADNGKNITLLLADGSTSKVQVSDTENLAMIQRGEVKAGDQISITYIQAVAISVDKAPKK